MEVQGKKPLRTACYLVALIVVNFITLGSLILLEG
jgi:hypothetical protein